MRGKINFVAYAKQIMDFQLMLKILIKQILYF